MNRNPTEARTEEETKGYPAEDTEPYEARYKTKYRMEQRRQYDTRPEEYNIMGSDQGNPNWKGSDRRIRNRSVRTEREDIERGQDKPVQQTTPKTKEISLIKENNAHQKLAETKECMNRLG